MLNKKKYFWFSVGFLLAMYVLFGLTNLSSIDNFRDAYEETLVDPLSYIALFSALVSFILLFFSNKIFKLWLRKIVSWFLPLSIFLIWAGGGGNNSYTTPDKTTYAIVLGIILSVVTLIFALVQRFYYKR